MSVSARVLRPFDKADLPALIDLWVESWSETGFAIDFGARRGWLEAHLRALQARGVSIVVGLDAHDRPAGFVTIDPATGHLNQLCVALGERGSGLASSLLDDAKRMAPGVVELDVNEANLRAVRFYEREGFKVIAGGFNPQSGLPTLGMRWTDTDRASS